MFFFWKPNHLSPSMFSLLYLKEDSFIYLDMWVCKTVLTKLYFNAAAICYNNGGNRIGFSRVVGALLQVFNLQGGRCCRMTVYEALTLMISFAGLVVLILSNKKD